MKKRTLVLVFALILAFTAACGSKAPAQDSNAGGEPDKQEQTGQQEETPKDDASAEPVTIKFANYALLEAGYDVYWNQLLDEFKKDNPNITVETVTAPYGEIMNTVINMAGGGDKVDLMYGELDWIPGMVEAGLAAPVAGILSEELLSDIYPNILNACSIDGEAYGVPMYVSPFLLYYNKDLFTKAGLDPNKPPTTYDEMLEMAPKLAALTTDDGNKVFAFGLTTASVPVSGACLTSSVHNFGGTVLDADGKLAIDDGFKEAVSMWKTLYEKGYNPENSKLKELRNLFALGQLAMYYDQSWGFNGVKSINTDAANYIASAPPLKGGNGKGESVLQAGTLMVMDNGDDAKKAATAKLVDYIMSKEKISQYFESVTPAYPARQSMEDLDVVKNSSILAGAAGSVGNVKPVTFIPTLSDLNLEICTLAQGVTLSGKDVDAAIEEFKTAAQNVIQ